uniref:Uncharacterized protein n=1 Tax=Setaria viridis TaxID=4556 RepID=A0A4U6TPD2_SETVI|nr:hypothetical protein SEVIR_7G125266v2 [Setaria viridis]
MPSCAQTPSLKDVFPLSLFFSCCYRARSVAWMPY